MDTVRGIRRSTRRPLIDMLWSATPVTEYPINVFLNDSPASPDPEPDNQPECSQSLLDIIPETCEDQQSECSQSLLDPIPDTDQQPECSQPLFYTETCEQAADTLVCDDEEDGGELQVVESDSDAESLDSTVVEVSSPPPNTPVSGTDDDDDEVDGWISSSLIRAVKAAALHLLNIVAHKYQKELCYGCQVDHPSQRQHPCLEKIDEDFYQLHFHRLMKKLCTNRFIPSIQRLLLLRNIHADDSRVKAVVETLLIELKSNERVDKAVADMYDNLIGMDLVRLEELQKVVECWNEF